MKRVIRALLLICIMSILATITCSGINIRMMPIKQYTLYTQNYIYDTQYEFRNRKILANKGYVVVTISEIYNLDKLNEFVNNMKAKKKSGIRVVDYINHGTPTIYDLKYNGKKVELTEDNRRALTSMTDRKVKKTVYDDFTAENLVSESSGAYTSYCLISSDSEKRLLLSVYSNMLGSIPNFVFLSSLRLTGCTSYRRCV